MIGNDLAKRFDEILSVLTDIDVDRVWEAASERERRVLIEELVQEVTIFPDHLEVTVYGAPKLTVAAQRSRSGRFGDCSCRRDARS